MKILSLDGGGVKGLIQTSALLKYQRETGIDIHGSFDLVIGTSVGSIIGGILATKQISIEQIHENLKYAIPKIFKKKPFFFFRKHMYDRENLTKTINKLIGKSYLLKSTPIPFMTLAINGLTGKVTLFKSTDNTNIPLYKVIERSAAAPVYFGGIPDDINKKVWIDGGVGISNNPSLYALLSANDADIISIGTGYEKIRLDYDRYKKKGIIGQALNYMKDGGFAHRYAEQSISNYVKLYCEASGTARYHRYNIAIPKKIDKIDGVKYMDEYEHYGSLLGEKLLNDNII